jgi:hypothetical protein
VAFEPIGSVCVNAGIQTFHPAVAHPFVACPMPRERLADGLTARPSAATPSIQGDLADDLTVLANVTGLLNWEILGDR